MVLNYRLFKTQRAQETSPDQAVQVPPQRQVWDINYEYLRSPVFYVKLVEMVRKILVSILSPRITSKLS